jgi:hypothetical protein
MQQRKFSTLTTMGIFALATANLASWALQRHTSLPDSTTDPTIGFLYGIAIATTLLGVWRQTRGRSSDCA